MWLALAALAAGCGFQLRTWDVATAFETVRIEADSSVDLNRDLARSLRRTGVRIVESNGDAVLALSRQRIERRSVAVSGAAQTAEVELALEVRFSATAGGAELVSERVLRSERVARLDRDNIAGSSAEQTLLAEEMRNDLVNRIMRTLGTVSKQEASSADSS